MQVTLNPITKTFTGSFKQVNLDELLPESDNWQRNMQKPIQAVVVPDKISRKPMMKTMVYAEDGVRTDTTVWEAQKDEMNKNIPDNIKNLCKFHGINPTEDLFMISGTNKDGQLFIIFNSFFRHEELFEAPKKHKPEEKENILRFVDCEQIYCMKSTNENPTPLQLDVVKLFNDRTTKNI